MCYLALKHPAKTCLAYSQERQHCELSWKTSPHLHHYFASPPGDAGINTTSRGLAALGARRHGRHIMWCIVVALMEVEEAGSGRNTRRMGYTNTGAYKFALKHGHWVRKRSLHRWQHDGDKTLCMRDDVRDTT